VSESRNRLWRAAAPSGGLKEAMDVREQHSHAGAGAMGWYSDLTILFQEVVAFL